MHPVPMEAQRPSIGYRLDGRTRVNPETPTSDPAGGPPPGDATVEIPIVEPGSPLAFTEGPHTFTIPAPAPEPFPFLDPAAGTAGDAAPPTTLLPSSARGAVGLWDGANESRRDERELQAGWRIASSHL